MRDVMKKEDVETNKGALEKPETVVEVLLLEVTQRKEKNIYKYWAKTEDFIAL
jgi:hypothetical protein